MNEAVRFCLFVAVGALAGAAWAAIGGSMSGTPLQGAAPSLFDPSTWFPAVTATPPGATPQADNFDVTVLARTAYGEARSAGSRGMQAVCNVVMNRVKAGTFPGGRSVSGICQAPGQFDAWKSGHANCDAMMAATASDQFFAIALSLARQAVAGTLADITNGAVYYYTWPVTSPPKDWGNVTKVASIGGLQLYA